jgi:FkbM family methyltransferase
MLKSSVKSFIHFFGFDFHRYSPLSSDDAKLVAMLKKHQVNLIFDVGANIGQFGIQLRNAGYDGRIVSFEPLSEARKKLLYVSSNDQLWNVAPQAAIGSEDGEIEIHVAGNSVSSSVLDMLDAHAVAAPDSAYVDSEKVQLRCLDTIGVDYIQSDSIFFMKIDTQGYEDKVLQGASNLLGNVIGLQLELSFIPLYHGQCLYDEMMARLKALGFELWGITPVFTDPVSGRLLQVDATFFRSSI